MFSFPVLGKCASIFCKNNIYLQLSILKDLNIFQSCILNRNHTHSLKLILLSFRWPCNSFLRVLQIILSLYLNSDKLQLKHFLQKIFLLTCRNKIFLKYTCKFSNVFQGQGVHVLTAAEHGMLPYLMSLMLHTQKSTCEWLLRTCKAAHDITSCVWIYWRYWPWRWCPWCVTWPWTSCRLLLNPVEPLVTGRSLGSWNTTSSSSSWCGKLCRFLGLQAPFHKEILMLGGS